MIINCHKRILEDKNSLKVLVMIGLTLVSAPQRSEWVMV